MTSSRGQRVTEKKTGPAENNICMSGQFTGRRLRENDKLIFKNESSRPTSNRTAVANRGR